ncbi:MAG: phosphate/phosphite/phosphonate ABC transporter substrate-binding protein [Anaerolineae bacterium]|nr:phosphate/phosphite/phosphonate ABC transporter substrate-binding protein [Anaerolineae bacterium]
MKTVGKNSRIYILLLCLVVLAVMMLSACSADTAPDVASAGDTQEAWPEKFVVGFFGGDDPNDVLESQEPFRVYLEEQLGIPVEMFTGTSYTAVIEAMRAKRVDAMQVGPFSYILAAQEAGAEALGAGVSTREEPAVYDPELKAHYFSVIFTKKGSGIDSLDDLVSKDFTFVDPASTSGHLMPKTLLIKNGLDPDKDMTTVFAGSHPSSVIAVWNDKADAGATYENNIYTLADEGQVEFCRFPDNQTSKTRTDEEIKAVYDDCPDGSLVILAYSDPIPSTPFAIRSDMSDSFKAAVKAALMDIVNQPELIAARASWYADPSEELGYKHLDEYYNGLRDVAKLLDLDLKAME